jgi:3-oxoacyl-[acyl-carrier-protein] synthase II
MNETYVVGSGAVNSIGRDVNGVFDSLCHGVSGLAGLRGFDVRQFRARSAYEIDDRPAPGIDVPGRATAILVEAIRQATGQAGVTELTGVPVLIGTGLRELRSLELWWRGRADFDVRGMHFGTALRELLGADTTFTFSNACAASLYALAMGGDLITLGEADTVVVASVDVITESMHGLLERVHATPPQCVRPFDRNRTGVLMGDGASAVVLRRDPGATPLGRLRSVAVNCDAYHVTAPDPEGIAAVTREAHRAAGITPADVDLLMFHGTGTLLNDEVEAAAMAAVFGADVGAPLATAIKSMTGHTSGASGLTGAVVALEALRTNLVPPTLGLTDPVPEAEGFRFPRTEPASERLDVAQVNAFGFGGVNAVAVMEAIR